MKASKTRNGPEIKNKGTAQANLAFEQAKKMMEVKKEAEKFRVGSSVRLLERKVLAYQTYIALVSMICMVLSIAAQEITFFGTYSNQFGGQWFDLEEYELPEHALEIHADPKNVTIMKFMISFLTSSQIVLMILQFRIINCILDEESELDKTLLEETTGNVEFNDQTAHSSIFRAGSILHESFGSYSLNLRLSKYFLELALSAVHPPPFVKKKFLMMVVGRACIYNMESWVQ
jgi:hypothetical protein